MSHDYCPCNSPFTPNRKLRWLYKKASLYSLVVVDCVLCSLNLKGSRTYHYLEISFCVCVHFLGDPQHNCEW